MTREQFEKVRTITEESGSSIIMDDGWIIVGVADEKVVMVLPAKFILKKVNYRSVKEVEV